MAPLPKRKHSTARKGRRRREKMIGLPNLVNCKECKRQKLPHRTCRYCGK